MTHYKADTTNDNVAKQLKAQSSAPLTAELERLSNELNTDIRDNLPPQMLAVVVGVLKLVEDIAEVPHENRK